MRPRPKSVGESSSLSIVKLEGAASFRLPDSAPEDPGGFSRRPLVRVPAQPLRLSWALVAATLLAGTAPAFAAQAFAGPTDPPVEAVPAAVENSVVATGRPDGMIFAEGTKAINEGRWADAIAIFSKLADRKTDHADGALYWKAYAENKLGKTDTALETCTALRTTYPGSSWLEDCGALEIELHAKGGKPVQPNAEHSDELKLLALNSMMQKNESAARAQLEEIVADEDASPKLKEGARFLLGQQHTGISYPQIVRLSYVEGDVRVARGREAAKETGADWEQAAANLPIESGYSLVTGAGGRAEIELEDASTLYLDQNSVLTMNDLHTTDGVPYTEMALLSGTVSLHVQPYVPGEMFILRTPTDDDLFAQYPNRELARVTSFTDATAITPLASGLVQLRDGAQRSVAGQTFYYKEGHRVEGPVNVDAADFAALDQWTASRVAQRKEAMGAMMKSAGLETPLPGLAELAGQGHFFDCEPYGKCWEPNTIAERDPADSPDAAPASEDRQAAANEGPIAGQAPNPRQPQPDNLQQPHKHGPIGFIPGPGGAEAPSSLSDLDVFPCMPDSLMYQGTGQMRLAAGGGRFSPFSYQWAVCHSGYWVHRRHHYAWVVGKRHHHPPFRWVKVGKTTAFVPIHPRDVKDKPPLNGRHEVFAVNSRGGVRVERVVPGPEHSIETLKDAPREFRTSVQFPLARAAEPHAEAHALKDAGAGHGAIAKAGVPIAFDHKSQSFMMATQQIHGGHSVTVMAPISNHSGNLQAHSGGGGSFGGGGSHSSGGGGGSSGGGSHSGGSSTSSSSSGSSSGTSSGGGGGGSHH